MSTEGIRIDNNAGNSLFLSPGFETTVARIAGAVGVMTPFVDTGNKAKTAVNRNLVVGGLAAATATPIKNILHGSASWNPGDLADGAVTEIDFTVTGAVIGDPVIASHDKIGVNSVLITAHVRQANVVRVILMNKTGGNYNIADGTVRVVVFNYS